MANLLRGEVPFSALGREMFVQYGTRELAEAQTALGFRRPDPHVPDLAEAVDEVVEKDGVRTVQRRTVVVDAAMRQARMIAAFEACLMNPDPDAALMFFRIGLRPWERAAGVKLTDDGFHGIVRAVGLVRMKELHYAAIQYGCYLKGEEDGEGKAASAASASST